MLDHVTATRYVVPLREGGSLPGVVEADDLGTYVVKFRGAGQGLKVLVAEVIVGELARALGLAIPRLATISLPTAIARYEADEEVQDLLNASPGTNLAVDLLPGALGWDGSRPIEPDLAARVVWLDALTANIDRTWANPNLLLWHGSPWLIDHGAALYFHHSWPRRAPDASRFAAQAYDASEHLLLPDAGDLGAVHEELAPRAAAHLDDVLDRVPTEWLETTGWMTDAAAVRTAYREHLTARLAASAAWLPGGSA
ncbi:MAG: aminotransferase class I and II [Intrasporangiaceae bacterium]|nr:aminotransferase class I and II [Intrasporangiaceae bacterium]